MKIVATFIWGAHLNVSFVHPKIGLSERVSLCLVSQEVETTKTLECRGIVIACHVN